MLSLEALQHSCHTLLYASKPAGHACRPGNHDGLATHFRNEQGVLEVVLDPRVWPFLVEALYFAYSSHERVHNRRFR